VARTIPVNQTPATGEPPIFARVAIVGFGLIGGSIALAIRRRWPRSLVIAVDEKPVIEGAMRAYAADVGGDDLVMAGDADLVVLAAPVLRNIDILSTLPEYLRADTLVTDVSSTKRLIVAAASAVPGLAFVGGHPMAGAAASGFRSANAGLFDGRPWILTPGPEHAARLGDLEAFVRGLGGSPQIMTPELHDAIVAAVSHLPQLAASALMHVVGGLAGDVGLEFAGAGLRDTTRLASSPAAIWKDIAATNEDVLREALDRLIATLAGLRESLGSGEAIDAVFTSAARWREALVRARGEE
jgi:prephenate dehydrogenase